MINPNVLIVGAGPTGLVLALWLTKLGVPVRIIDKAPKPGTTSRALAVHARTLGCIGSSILPTQWWRRATRFPAPGFGSRDERRSARSFEQLVSDLTPYGFLHIFPEDEHEQLLIAQLEELDVRVERPTELMHFVEREGRIEAHLRSPDGTESQTSVDFIAGYDGRDQRCAR